jgi:hypothetical protein
LKYFGVSWCTTLANRYSAITPANPIAALLLPAKTAAARPAPIDADPALTARLHTVIADFLGDHVDRDAFAAALPTDALDAGATSVKGLFGPTPSLQALAFQTKLYDTGSRLYISSDTKRTKARRCDANPR